MVVAGVYELRVRRGSRTQRIALRACDVRVLRSELLEAGAVHDFNGVGFDNFAAGLVIDLGVKDGFEVLNKRAVAPDVEALQPLADAEDGLVEVEGVLQKKHVDGGACGIGRTAGGNAFFSVARGIDIETTAGKKNSLSRGEEGCDVRGAFVEGDDESLGTCGLKRGKILREGALVVFDVGGGRLGDGDANGHAEISLSEDWWGRNRPSAAGSCRTYLHRTCRIDLMPCES